MTIEIEGAEVYSCDDAPEELTSASPGEAVEEWLEQWREHHQAQGRDAEILRKHGPVILRGFKRAVLTDKFVRGQTERLVEDACDAWAEEYGDQDGYHVLEDSAALEAAHVAVHAALKTLFESEVPRTCEEVGKVTLTDAQALELTAGTEER